jgi:hypothetical protein
MKLVECRVRELAHRDEGGSRSGSVAYDSKRSVAVAIVAEVEYAA